jgi:hypothetical protein
MPQPLAKATVNQTITIATILEMQNLLKTPTTATHSSEAERRRKRKNAQTKIKQKQNPVPKHSRKK